MYDHNAKVAGWITARAVLEVVVLPGLVGLYLLAHHIFDRSGLVDVAATVTKVSEVCRAEKRDSASPPNDLLLQGEFAFDCVRFQALVAQGLKANDYRVVEASKVSFRYRSPSDNQVHVGSGILDSRDVVVGDEVQIKASRSDFRKTVVNPNGA